ncbi:MAG: hypothetical protein JSV88_32350 [Candidatus Aminicenantes bacterium]|nr:MAG: hypothetical protein JSV88_32350 [Candidatus Aminicenantes bacterium]
MRLLKILMVLIAVFSFFNWTKAQEHEKIVEKVEVVNIEVPVRVFSRGEPVAGLEKSDFKLLVNGEERPINAFFEIRKKIKPTESDLQTAALTPRLFVLIFNVSDYDAYLQKNIDYFFKKVIRPQDRLMVITNNFFLNDKVIENVQKEKKRLKKILELEAKRIRLELFNLKNKLKSLLEDKDDRTGDEAQNARIFVQDYLHYLKGFKRVYFDPQSDRYIKIAKYLKNQPIEKWVFNFFQLGMFYYPHELEEFIEGISDASEAVDANVPDPNAEDVKEIQTLDLLESYLQAYKELQVVDKNLVDNLGKLFINSGATFHTQLLKNTTHSILPGFSYLPISLNSENVFTNVAEMTGGSVFNSNKIKTFVEQVMSKEDIYYTLTYNPGKLKEKNQQVKIMVNNDTYRVVYDDQKRPGDFLKLEKKAAKKDPQVLLENVSFAEGILSFTISNIKLLPTEKGGMGKVLVKIRIINMESRILYAREREIEFTFEKQELKIKLPQLEKGQYDALIEIYDRSTGKNDLAIKTLWVRNIPGS